jgi:hypothetical protein
LEIHCFYEKNIKAQIIFIGMAIDDVSLYRRQELQATYYLVNCRDLKSLPTEVL